MSLFSEERGSELRDFFFETAAELLQSLNEQGLQLEQRPNDPEVVREVRRTVHTLKGDAAACGFLELSGLAHELEDVLTHEVASGNPGTLAEAVLAAADVFASILTAYRDDTSLPSIEKLREQVRHLVAQPAAKHVVPYKLSGRFVWNEYEQICVEQAIAQGRAVFNIALAVDPHCPMKTAAVQLVRNVLSQLGEVLAAFPDSASDQLDVMEFAVATSLSPDAVEKKCFIPSVTSNVLVEPCPLNSSPKAARGAELLLEDELGDVLGISELAESGDANMPADAVAEAAQSTHLSSSTVSKLKVDAERIDTVLNLVGELVIGKSMLMQTMSDFDKRFAKDPLRGKFADAMAFQARVLNDLQKSVMKIRMVPVEQLFRRFPRMVRDTAKSCGKDAILQISGGETDLDKSILDVLAEPLSHLVRNAVDHGLETPAERTTAGKSAQGTVRLNAYHLGNQIVIECSDDGRGIDRKKLLSKAIERGVVAAEEAGRLNDSEAMNLVFHPGLSTAEQVTEISGRGVGLDVVRTVVEKLKGTISIESKHGAGSCFLLKVPLTLAIIKALMFRVADRLYAVPLASVVEIARASEANVHRVDQHEVMQLRNQVLTLVRMGRLVKNRSRSEQTKIFIVVVAIADRRFGLIVDRLVGEEELVIKALDDHLVATELVSGASILGDGSVVLILNLSAVVARLGKAPVVEEAVMA